MCCYPANIYLSAHWSEGIEAIYKNTPLITVDTRRISSDVIRSIGHYLIHSLMSVNTICVDLVLGWATRTRFGCVFAYHFRSKSYRFELDSRIPILLDCLFWDQKHWCWSVSTYWDTMVSRYVALAVRMRCCVSSLAPSRLLCTRFRCFHCFPKQYEQIVSMSNSKWVDCQLEQYFDQQVRFENWCFQPLPFWTTSVSFNIDLCPRHIHASSKFDYL